MNNYKSIENEYLKVSVSLMGGALTSIIDKKTNEELLYQKDERSWSGQDVVIFPFVGALKDRIYTVEGIKYSMKNHGVARYSMFTCVKNENEELVINLTTNKEIEKYYPYLFSLDVTYTLVKNKLQITYKVNNIDTKPIYFSLGGHPALKVDGYETDNEFIIKDTKLYFEKEMDTKRYFLNEEGNLISYIDNYKIPKVMNISKDMLKIDKTIILDSSSVNQVTLNTKNRAYTFDTSKSEILALWTMEGYGDYFCVEPWWGIPDMANPNLELKDKPLIHKLESKSFYITGYSIEFN